MINPILWNQVKINGAPPDAKTEITRWGGKQPHTFYNLGNEWSHLGEIHEMI